MVLSGEPCPLKWCRVRLSPASYLFGPTPGAVFPSLIAWPNHVHDARIGQRFGHTGTAAVYHYDPPAGPAIVHWASWGGR